MALTEREREKSSKEHKQYKMVVSQKDICKRSGPNVRIAQKKKYCSSLKYFDAKRGGKLTVHRNTHLLQPYTNAFTSFRLSSSA